MKERHDNGGGTAWHLNATKPHKCIKAVQQQIYMYEYMQKAQTFAHKHDVNITKKKQVFYNSKNIWSAWLNSWKKKIR